MPKEWYTYKANKINVDKETGEILDDEETIRLKEFNSKIMVNKKPYFFIYNYPELENDYNKFMSLVEDNCILRFCKTFSQLEEIGATNDEEEIFLNSVKYKYPVFKNTSIMNKICYIFENEFKNIRHKVKDSKDFDYRIYRSNNRKVKDEIFKEIEKVFKEYLKELKDDRNIYDRRYDLKDYNEEDIMKDFTIIDLYKEKLYKVCPDKYILCNALLDLTYGKNGSNKNIVWNICGEQIINNLLSKNDNKYTILVKDDNGNVEWNGNRFSEKQVEVC